MPYTLLETPDKTGGYHCCDAFSGSDDMDCEEYYGLGYCNDSQTAYHFLMALGHRLRSAEHAYVEYSDGCVDTCLLIHKDDWENPKVREEWAEVFAMSVPEMVEMADLTHDGWLRTEIVEHMWLNEPISDRMSALIDMDHQDLTDAFHDEPPDEWITHIIEEQIVELLDNGES